MKHFERWLVTLVAHQPRRVVLAFVLVALAAGLAAPLQVSHDYADWIDQDSAHYQRYAMLREQFGDADTLLAVFDRSALDDAHYPAYAALVDRIAARPGVLAVLDPARLLLGADDRHAPDALDAELLARTMRGRPADYRNVLVARDMKTLGLLVLADPAARATHAGLIESVRNGFDSAGIRVDLAGTIWFSEALADAIGRDLARVMTLLALTAAVLLRLFLRDTRLVAAIFLGIGLALVYALSLASAFGLHLDLLTLLLPLVIGVGLTTAVHLFTRRRAGTWDYAAALAALTTALGCAAFAVAPQPVVARMGMVMPGAVLLTFLTSVLFVPALLAWLAPTRVLPPLAGCRPRPTPGVRRTVSLLLVLLSLGALASLGQLRTAPDALDFFSHDSALVEAYSRIEQRLTGLLVADVVITSSDGDSVRSPAHTADIARFSARLRELPELTTLVSGYDLPDVGGFGTAPPELGGALFSADERAARLVLRLRNVDARPWRTIAADIARDWAAIPHAGLQMQLTGTIPLILEAQDRLLVIQSRMLLVVMGVICGVLFVALREPRLFAPALAANFMPLAITAGCMAWLAIPLNSINLFVGSVMLGIVVDDTVHLMHARRRRASMDAALDDVGQALWITSMTVGLAFATLAASELVPIRQFGLLSAIAVSVAWLCDVCLLPTLVPDRVRHA